MLDWLKKLLPAVTPPEDTSVPKTPDEAIVALQGIISDAVIEDVWDAMDMQARVLEPRVRELLEQEQLGEYPRHAAILWLSYQLAKSDRELDEFLLEQIEESIIWAFQFEENHVLLGGALGVLDGLEPDARETLALTIFDALGEKSLRRYWLVLKVRTDAMVEKVADALDDFEPAMRPKMGGAFRQFEPEDVDVLLAHYRPESSGAELMLEALAATGSPKARGPLTDALDDPRDGVREIAERGLRILDAG